MSDSATIATELDLELVVPEHGGVPLTASLCYRGDDPYAIRMAFHVGMESPVEWIFSRDLLAEGLDHHTGEGDVRIWPSCRREVLNISLSSPHGRAHFEAPLAAFTAFLLRTAEAVPPGRERESADIDGELDSWLRPR